MSPIIKSVNDTREYKYIILDNQLKCLLVSDPDNETSGVSMSVGVGSFDSPIDLAGLPHLLEHMLFFGSKTYPDEDYYDKFVKTNGGYTNAYTASENTVYHFSINSDFLDHALDIFSHFFIDPVFNKEMVDREVNAVDAEFYKSYNNEKHKEWQIYSSLMDDDYPICKFNTGNKKTLIGDDLHERMLDFYYTNYSSDRMGLVVVSKQDINEIEVMIRNKFSKIRNNNFNNNNKIDYLPYNKFLSTKFREIPLIKTESIDGTSNLVIQWQLLSDHNCLNKSASYWANIIGHEGKGSLLSYLKNKSWVTSLGAGRACDYKRFTTFHISMTLTDIGNNNITNIITTIYAFLKLLLNMSYYDIKRLYDENKYIAELDFNNKEKESSDQYAIYLSEILNDVDPEHILDAYYYYPEFDEKVLRELIDYITVLYATKPYISHKCPNYNGKLSLKETIYDSAYDVEWLEIDFNIKDIPELKIPEENIYIPRKFTILMDTNNDIQKITESNRGELWYLLDTSFNLPKYTASFDVVLPYIFEKNYRIRILANLYDYIIQDIVNEELYPARLVDITCSLNSKWEGLKFFIDGYSDMNINAFRTLIKVIEEFNCTNSHFKRAIESSIKKYKKFNTKNTQKQIYNELDLLYITNKIPHNLALEILETITIQDIYNFEKEMYSNYYYVGFVYGNCSYETCRELEQMICNVLDKKNIYNINNLKIESLNDFYKSPEFRTYNFIANDVRERGVNHSILIRYDFGSYDFKDYKNITLHQILSNLLNISFFDDLRTKQQLGYTVQVNRYCYEKPFDQNKMGLNFTIQSNQYNCAYLRERIENFINDIHSKIEEKSFNDTVESIKKILEEPFQNDSEKFNYYNNIIEVRTEDFNKNSNTIKVLNNLTFNDLINFINDNIVNNPNKLILNVE